MSEAEILYPLELERILKGLLAPRAERAGQPPSWWAEKATLVQDSHEALRAEVERLEKDNRHHQVALQVAARELQAKVPRDSALYEIIRLAEKDALIALGTADAETSQAR